MRPWLLMRHLGIAFERLLEQHETLVRLEVDGVLPLVTRIARPTDAPQHDLRPTEPVG